MDFLNVRLSRPCLDLKGIRPRPVLMCAKYLV